MFTASAELVSVIGGLNIVLLGFLLNDIRRLRKGARDAKDAANIAKSAIDALPADILTANLHEKLCRIRELETEKSYKEHVDATIKAAVVELKAHMDSNNGKANT